MGRSNSARYVKDSLPKVSVLVPTYNRRSILPRTLTSLLSQSYKNIELIVINDAGEDVKDVIDNFNDDRIKYISNEKNLGLAGARNVGLKNCTGQYICLCDDDDIYLRYAIEFRMYMMKKLSADIVYTRSLLDHWKKVENGYVSTAKTLYWDSKFEKDLILVQNIAPCCNILFSRKSWEDSNYWFQTDMNTSEDHDFWCALSRKYDFENLEIIDTECSQRDDKSQMTGSLNFLPNWIKIFKRWRPTAINLQWVTESQNNILKNVGVNPADYGL